MPRFKEAGVASSAWRNVGLPTRATNSVRQHQLIFRILRLKSSNCGSRVSCQFWVVTWHFGTTRCGKGRSNDGQHIVQPSSELFAYVDAPVQS